MYDIVRLDEKLLLNALARVGISVKLVNSEQAIAPDQLGEVGLVRAAARSRVIPLAFTYELSGGVAINSAQSLAVTHDKYLTYLALKRAGVATPRSLLAFGIEGVKTAAERLDFPLVVKPTDGSWGRFVSLVKSLEDLETLAAQRQAMESDMHLYLLQEYVDKPGRDIRVTVVGSRAVAAIYRINSSDWRTNTARGGRAEPVKIDPELEEIAVRAHQAVGALYSGIDVVESERGYMVLEINGVPEFKNVQRATGVDVAGEIAEAVKIFIKR